MLARLASNDSIKVKWSKKTMQMMKDIKNMKYACSEG